MRDCSRVKIIISHPSDTEEEVQVVKHNVYQWNVIHHDEPYMFLPLEWCEDAYPMSGKHPQKIIDDQIITSSELMICVFKEKIGSVIYGTNTTGMEHEIQTFYKMNRPIMIFVKKDLVNSITFKDIKKAYENYALFATYNDINDFKSKFPYYLGQFIRDKYLNVQGTRIFTPHILYGADYILQNAKKRIILDAVFYPYYCKTGDINYYRNLFNSNKDAEVDVIFPTQELLFMRSDFFDGYNAYLNHRANISTVSNNIEQFIKLKKELGDEHQERFKIWQCPRLLLYPYVMVDDTMLVGHFAHSECNTPLGLWIKLDLTYVEEMLTEESVINSRTQYDCSKSPHRDVSINNALYRYREEYAARKDASDEIKTLDDWKKYKTVAVIGHLDNEKLKKVVQDSPDNLCFLLDDKIIYKSDQRVEVYTQKNEKEKEKEINKYNIDLAECYFNADNLDDNNEIIKYAKDYGKHEYKIAWEKK